jgi:SAM-dependent methyltransferase
MGRSSLRPLSNLSPESTRVEEARIRVVYEKRQGDARYSWFSPGQLFMAQERERRLLALLTRYDCSPLDAKKILEVGCGTGYWLREFIKWGARPEHITGIDLLPGRVAEARWLCPRAVGVYCGTAAKLSFSDATFDLVLQFTVFSSILDPGTKQQLAAEMLRVMKGDGLILWYDYHVNNPWNPDVRGIKKREIYLLFPECWIELRRISLAPPLARWLAPHSWVLASLLEKIPWLRTYYLGVIRKQK